MVLRIVLGAVYLAMAAGQLASWSSMPRILGAYDAAPASIVPWLAAVPLPKTSSAQVGGVGVRDHRISAAVGRVRVAARLAMAAT